MKTERIKKNRSSRNTDRRKARDACPGRNLVISEASSSITAPPCGLACKSKLLLVTNCHPERSECSAKRGTLMQSKDPVYVCATGGLDGSFHPL
jgi:hypothetical protein